MDLTPEVDHEVIIESVSHKLDNPIFNTSNKVCRDSTQTKTPTSPFQIVEFIIYTNEVHNDIVELVYIKHQF